MSEITEKLDALMNDAFKNNASRFFGLPQIKHIESDFENGMWVKGVDEISGKTLDFNRASLADESFDGTYLTANHESGHAVVNEEAVADVRAIQAKWREKGWSEFVDLFDKFDEENDSIVESLYTIETRFDPIKIKNPEFYNVEYDYENGLRSLVTDEPRTFARITNLSIENLIE